MLEILEAAAEDFERIWPIFQVIVSAGDTYAYPRNVTKAEGHHLWMVLARKTFGAVDNGELPCTYYLKINQASRGAHVCNCGYVGASAVRGRGIAAAMCEHSQRVTRDHGHEATQFNLVASTTKARSGCGRNSALRSSAGYRGPSNTRSKSMSTRWSCTNG